MVIVTEYAAHYLREALACSDAAPGQAFRLSLENDEFSLELDQRQADDQAIELEGSVVLLMSPEVSGLVSDSVIHCVGQADEAQLVIGAREDVVQGKCNCGCQCDEHQCNAEDQ